MSAALDTRHQIGGNNPPPEIDPTVYAIVDAELLLAQLETDHAGLVTKTTDLLAGAVRLIRRHGDTPSVEALPLTGRTGDIVRVVDAFYRRVGKEWQQLTDRQVVAQLLPLLVIPDAEIAAKVTSFAKQMKETANKLIEPQRVIAKAPYDTGFDTVQAFFKAGMQDPLTGAAKCLEASLTTYQRRQAQIEREAREAEAQRLRDEAAAAAAAAVRTEHVDMIETAEEAAIVADRAQKAAAAPIADLARVSGSHGGTSAATTVWTWEIEDESKIPREYFVLDRARIDREVRSQKNGFAVPGIKVTSDIKARVL